MAAAEVDVGRCQIAETFVIAAVIIVGDEVVDLSFEVAWQIVMFEQDAVFERLVPALDLALGHGMVGRTTDMIHAALFEPFGQIAGDIA